MNTVQYIINIILKSMFDKFFSSNYIEEERDLIQSLKMIEEVSIEHSFNEGIVLRWRSVIGQTVACKVDPTGFYFTQTKFYKDSTRTTKELVKDKAEAENLALVEEEIENFKRIFRVYSQDAEGYFK